MVITKMKIGKREYYSVNGFHVRADAMNAIGEEIFTPEGWAIIAQTVATQGYASCKLGTSGITREAVKDALAATKEKNAVLEKAIG